MAAAFEVYDELGQVTYSTEKSHGSYYKIGEFNITFSHYPNGSSEGNGTTYTVLSDSRIVSGSSVVVCDKPEFIYCYSYGHYPAHSNDGYGGFVISVVDGAVKIQFVRNAAEGTKGFHYLVACGKYSVYGERRRVS